MHAANITLLAFPEKKSVYLAKELQLARVFDDSTQLLFVDLLVIMKKPIESVHINQNT